MNTLNKYLIKQSFIPFVLSVGVITTVLFLQFLMRAIDRFLGKGLDVVIILEYLYLNLAWIIALSVPMSLLISSVMTYGRMSQENEITALKSAGVNLFSIIKPALWFGSIVGFLLCLFNNFILPDMNYNARLLARDIYQKKPELTIEPGYFVDMIPQYTMIVKELDGNEFKDVKIFSKNTQSEQTTIYAERGSLESKDGIITVNLQNGEIHEIDLENYDHYRKIKFGTHQIIISMNDLLLNRTSESNRTDREMKVPAMIEKIQQNKKSIEQIKKRIETVKNDIGIESNSQMTLAGIMDQIEILKKDTSSNVDEHRDYNKVDSGVNWLFKALYNSFGEHVLGPTAPAVSRIRNQYIKNIVIKIPPKQSLANTKNQLSKIKNTFEAVKDFRPIRFIIDVDAY